MASLFSFLLPTPALYFQWAAIPYSAIWCISQVRICVSRYQLFVAGNEYWLIDQLNTIMRVGGVDYAKDIRNVL